MEIGEKLKKVRKDNKITQEELAKRLNVSPKTVVFWESGKSIPSSKNITSVCNIFNLPNNYFMKELTKISPYSSPIERALKKAGSLSDEEFNSLMPTVTLEHIGIKPSCGTGTSVYDNAEIVPVTLGLDLINSIFKVSDPKKLKLFTASGDSMETTIYDCDMLLVDESRQDYNNGGIFIITINNEWYCKRLRLKLNGDLEIISDNPKYEKEIKHPNDEIEIKIIGKVIRNLSKGL